MSQMSDRNSADRRLRFLRYGLVLLTAVAFALASGVGFFGAAGNLGGGLLQGAIWGVGAAVVSVIIYFVYKSVVVKA